MEATMDRILFDADYYEDVEVWRDEKRAMAETYVDREFIEVHYPKTPDMDIDDAIDLEADGMDDWAVWDAIDWMMREDLSDVICEVGQQVGDGTVVFIGTVDLWDGAHRGGGTADSFADAISEIEGRDCELQTIEVIDGDVHVTLTHHDGASSFTVRALTCEGRDAFEEWEACYDDTPLAGMSESEAYDALMTSDSYSHSIAPEW